MLCHSGARCSQVHAWTAHATMHIAANAIAITTTSRSPATNSTLLSIIGSDASIGRRAAASRTQVITHPMT